MQAEAVGGRRGRGNDENKASYLGVADYDRLIMAKRNQWNCIFRLSTTLRHHPDN